ncbi:60S ribosomal protein L9 [Dirofilaria immitis]|nr:60S ribosomal protein L9 [Dirofilaria immitis]
MKLIEAHDIVKFPENVTFSVNKQVVTVKEGFPTLAYGDRKISKNTVRVRKWFGIRKEVAAIHTVCSHIKNMIKGVTKGFRYKMRSVHAHFPINISLQEKNTIVEVANSEFLGEKYTRRVPLPEGVTATMSATQKDELIIDGSDLQLVSQAGLFRKIGVQCGIADRHFALNVWCSESSEEKDEIRYKTNHPVCTYSAINDSKEQGYSQIFGWYICQ